MKRIVRCLNRVMGRTGAIVPVAVAVMSCERPPEVKLASGLSAVEVTSSEQNTGRALLPAKVRRLLPREYNVLVFHR